MTNQIDELMRLSTALPVAVMGPKEAYIAAVDELRTALEAALGDLQVKNDVQALVILDLREQVDKLEAALKYPLPDDLYDSKDWKAGGYAQRVEWLHVMYESAKQEVGRLEAALKPPVLEDIEQYRLQMAGISTASFGYWKVGDGIHPDYDTLALRDVAKLYTKYDELYKAALKPGEPVGYLPAYEVSRLRSGHDANIRSARFGPSKLDWDIPVYTAAPPAQKPVPHGWWIAQSTPEKLNLWPTDADALLRLSAPPAQTPASTVTVSYDLSPAETESAIHQKLIEMGWTPPAQTPPRLTPDELWKFWWNRPEVPEGGDDSMEAEFVAAARAVESAVRRQLLGRDE